MVDYAYPWRMYPLRTPALGEQTMKTPEYLDLVKRKLDLPSDYALQKPLGVTKQLISKYRNEIESLSDAMAIRVADLCGMDSAKVLLDMHIERSKTPEVRAAWSALMEKLAGVPEKISKGFETLLSGVSPIRSKAPAC
jgi:plasmid maintenance system antidote protein VapI